MKNRKGYSLWCFRAFRERVFFKIMYKIVPKLPQTIYISLSYAILHHSRLFIMKSKILTFLKNRKGYIAFGVFALFESAFFSKKCAKSPLNYYKLYIFRLVMQFYIILG